MVVKGGIRVFFIMWRTISLSLLSVVCMFGATGAEAVVQSYSFTINGPTDVYVFRGDDGNAGTVNVDGNVISGGGGAVQAKFTLAQNLDGGAGGSGTTGTSASSFVRIYKFG